MDTLILNSLEIRRFRTFRHLRIERLGRVNLIVGKNNVGKSSLLEALQLYARRGSPALIWELLGARDEGRRSPLYKRYEDQDIETLLSALKYLFYGREDIKSHLEPIQIGPVDPPDKILSLAVGWYMAQIDEEKRLSWQPIQPEEYAAAGSSVPRFTIQLGKARGDYSLAPPIAMRSLGPDFKEIDNIFLSANGLGRLQVGRLWDSIALTDLEQEILAALRIIAPGVERLSLVEDPVATRAIRESTSGRERVPIVKVASIDDPLPLRSLGDGMQRIFGIVLALVNARDGMLLVDEIENGIHYSVQPDLWRLIFQVARRLNVQVFATSHSWDCIEGFQKAAQEDTQAEGLLIRLESKNSEVVATLFDERKLGIATREQIEVR
jgi:hypothetical protein